MKRREFTTIAFLSFLTSLVTPRLKVNSQPASQTWRQYNSWKSDNIFLKGINAPVFYETDLNNLKVTGAIPSDLEGIYIRNGPNQLFKPVSYNYPLEGDGMLHAFYFEDSKVRYRNRWIWTRGLKYELYEGKVLPEFKFRNYANTNIFAHAGVLLALYEAGLPYQITPKLETVGTWNFQGDIEQSMAAHPKLDPQTGELHFFRYSLINPPYITYYVANRQGKIIRTMPIDLPQSALLHDMAITKNYVIFFHCPLVFEMSKAMKCNSPFVWKPEMGTKIILIHRHDLTRKPVRLDTDAFWLWHFMNAHEENEQIVIDFVYYPQIKLESTLEAILATKAHLHRFTVNPDAKTIKSQPLDDRFVDLPTIDPRQTGKSYQFGYAPYIDLKLTAQKKIPNYYPEIIQYNVREQTSKVHRFKPGCYGGEAIFVPKKNGVSELDGYVMTLVFDENQQKSDLLILDPANFEDEPIARIHLPVRVPSGFHGNWIAKDALNFTGI